MEETRMKLQSEHIIAALEHIVWSDSLLDTR